MRRFTDSTEYETLLLRNFNNFVKAALIQGAAGEKRDLHVLDLACGKGGDLPKWAKHGVKRYVGVDANAASIEEARRRNESQHHISDATFHVMDFDEVGGAAFGQFDVVSCMFALHYAFASKARMDSFMQCVARSLKPGGVFVAVTTDTEAVMRRLWASPSMMCGNRLYRMQADRANTYHSPYGNKLVFELAEVAAPMDEFIVNDFELKARLRALGEPVMRNLLAYGLEMVEQQSELASRMRAVEAGGRAISDEEKEIAALYRTIHVQR